MQVTPALPWGTTTEGGVIKLKKAVTRQDLLDGILRWTLDKNATDEVGQIVAGELGDRKLYVANTRGDKVYTIAAFTDPTTKLTLTRHTDAPADTSLKSAVFPAVIAPQGDVQIFKDRFGYEYASGVVSKLYARVNNPWVGLNSGWAVLNPSDEGSNFSAIGPELEGEPYGMEVYLSFATNDQITPYEEGEIVEVIYAQAGTLDVTGYDTIFRQPVIIYNNSSFASTSNGSIYRLSDRVIQFNNEGLASLQSIGSTIAQLIQRYGEYSVSNFNITDNNNFTAELDVATIEVNSGRITSPPNVNIKEFNE